MWLHTVIDFIMCVFTLLWKFDFITAIFKFFFAKILHNISLLSSKEILSILSGHFDNLCKGISQTDSIICVKCLSVCVEIILTFPKLTDFGFYTFLESPILGSMWSRGTNCHQDRWSPQDKKLPCNCFFLCEVGK